MNDQTATPTEALALAPAAHPDTGWARGYQMTPDVMENVLENLPEHQADVLRWWYFHGRSANLSLAHLAKLAGVSSSTLSMVFRGVYGADLESVCRTLAKARDTMRERVGNPEFIMTSLAKRIFMICDRARALQTIAICWGTMGIGKTAIAEEYRDRNNHGRTIYFCCDSGMTLNSFIVSLAAALGITPKGKTQLMLRDRIRRMLSAGQRQLIIDEAHQLFLTTQANSAIKIAEFLRLAQEACKCGLVLLGTEVLRHEIFAGQHKEALRQLVDRGTIQVPLPAKPTKKDIGAFLRHYGLEEPTEESDPVARRILADILAASGLRKLTLHLRDGASFAAKLGEPYTWPHFVRAFKDIAALSES